MSKYTTGEIAKICGVSVRTVQYYDSRNILVPSELSEGGRRIYTEEDLRKMKIICFLRDLGFSINSIGELFSEKEPQKVIALLLSQQKAELKEEISESQTKLNRLEQLTKELKNVENFSVEVIGDIAHIMKNKKKLYKIRTIILSVGLVMEAIEIGTLLLGVKTGIWWPFAIGMCFVIAGSIRVSAFYYKKVAYICPQCHHIFKPGFKEMFFARHTPTTRKLTCKKCGHKGFCVETYGEDQNEAS